MPNRSVYQRPDGNWVNKRDDNERATSLHDTQSQAESTAREQLRREGGGELSIHGTDGRIRQKDTVPPGHDPFPPRG